MKQIFTLIILFGLALNVNAQERYLSEVFTDVEMSTEVYAVNATVLQLGTAGRRFHSHSSWTFINHLKIP